MKHKILSSLVLTLAFNSIAVDSAVKAQVRESPQDRQKTTDTRVVNTHDSAIKTNDNVSPLLDKKPVKTRQTWLAIEAETGKVLFEQNADQRVYPASVTKLMTLYLAFEQLEKGKLKLDQPLTTSSFAARQPRSKLFLKKGEIITVEQAISGMAVPSGNDAAVVMAEAIGGNLQNFAKMMNAKAKELGLSKTTYANPTGLTDRRQMTTARDMVKLAQAHLRDFPQYRKYLEQKTFLFNGYEFRNTNALLRENPELGIDFSKTGYTSASLRCLNVSAQRNGVRVYAAVFGFPDKDARNEKVKTLLTDSFAKVVPMNPVKPTTTTAAPVPSPSPSPVRTATHQLKPDRKAA